jgi:hypothetical protein
MHWVTGLYSKSMLGTHDLSRCCMFCCFISIYQFTYNESGCNLSWAPWFNYRIRQSSFRNFTIKFCLGSTSKFYHDSDAMVFFVANFCISVTSHIKPTVLFSFSSGDYLSTCLTIGFKCDLKVEVYMFGPKDILTTFARMGMLNNFHQC